MHIGNISHCHHLSNLTIPRSFRVPEDSDARCNLESNRMIEDKELERIADTIASCWKEIGENLAVDSDYLDYLERENVPAIRNRNAPYRMLFYWTQKYVREATFGKLKIALTEARKFKVLQKLQNLNDEGGT